MNLKFYLAQIASGVVLLDGGGLQRVTSEFWIS